MGKKGGRKLGRLLWNDKHSFCVYLKRMCVRVHACTRTCAPVYGKREERVGGTIEREETEGKKAETKGRRAWWDKCTSLTKYRGPLTHTHAHTHGGVSPPPTDRQSPESYLLIIFSERRGLIRARSILEPTISAPADYIRASAENSVGSPDHDFWRRAAPCRCIRGNCDQSAVLAANLLLRVTFEPELGREHTERKI